MLWKGTSSVDIIVNDGAVDVAISINHVTRYHHYSLLYEKFGEGIFLKEIMALMRIIQLNKLIFIFMSPWKLIC